MSPSLDELHVGHIVARRTIAVDRQMLRDYAEASGDHNRIHTDDDFARSVGLPGVIAHGMWTMGAAADVVTTWVGDPRAVVKYSTRFTQPLPVPPSGAVQIEVSAVVAAVDPPNDQVTVDLTVLAQGAEVLRRARAIVDLRRSGDA